jgi:hypothetical protein
MQAMLEKYDSMPVISLSLPELLAEATASSPEEALVRRMAQARKQVGGWVRHSAAHSAAVDLDPYIH